ncbi:hypothetical protein N7463_000197 [Penicillium fimorum]|uniref:Uncharacterized protein n=1 Tax=Penicillium fimorum TaxID=1882269 RepID=A0A9W9Y3T4_9EURO|nr:hypothetical protein N7463_000197 [Penicillium fimorum]
MGSAKDSTPPLNHLRELKMHDCLIEVTRRESDESTAFCLGGYLGSGTHINPDGIFDPTMLGYNEFEQDLYDHLRLRLLRR